MEEPREGEERKDTHFAMESLLGPGEDRGGEVQVGPGGRRRDPSGEGDRAPSRWRLAGVSRAGRGRLQAGERWPTSGTSRKEKKRERERGRGLEGGKTGVGLEFANQRDGGSRGCRLSFLGREIGSGRGGRDRELESGRPRTMREEGRVPIPKLKASPSLLNVSPDVLPCSKHENSPLSAEIRLTRVCLVLKQVYHAIRDGTTAGSSSQCNQNRGITFPDLANIFKWF
ncbi:hypothetical protein KFK09_008315 [Dendrobium nobile]|uniref:Uncharacterized protein n=1 Tax=Dendrobium nobile TaxID=94219 RepID=A0A8T3BME2_DENNO|nr:hypothetical protein KFK09_008315 [Dendrobium nobile]